MTPAERINAIRELSTHFVKQENREVDLVMRTFGVIPFGSIAECPGAVATYGDSHEVLQGATDSQLLGIYEYCMGRLLGEAAATRTDSPWHPGRFKLFISHSSDDKRFVADVAKRLEHYAIQGFVAHVDIEPTAEWAKVIDSALRTCDGMLAYLTTSFPASKWASQEVGYCLFRQVLIVSARAGCDPFGFMAKEQAMDASGKDSSAVAGEVFGILLMHPRSRDKIAISLAAALESADSYDEVRDRLKLVEQVESWPGEGLSCLARALNQNPEVYTAKFGNYPDRLREILKHHGWRGSEPKSPGENVGGSK